MYKVISLFIILIITVINAVSAQYKLDKSIYTDAQKIDFKSSPYGNLLFKRVGESAYIYSKQVQQKNDSTTFYVVSRVDLNTEKILAIDSIQIPNPFRIKDILPLKDKTLIISHSQALLIDSGTTLIRDKSIDFHSALALNDSLVLLYELYNYHPADGKCGLHMNIFNLNTHQITKSVVHRFPGIAISFKNIVWVTNDKKYIYAFAGISGRVFKYDFDLNKVSEQNMAIFSDSVTKSNLKYESELDSTVYSDWFLLRKVIDSTQKLGLNNHYTSAIHSKDFITELSKEVRENRYFIDKVFKIDDDNIFITVSAPGYDYYFRDVYVYNLKKNTISLKYKKWHCGKLNIVENPEDYFCVDLVNDLTIAPFFYKKSVYAVKFYDINLFKPGEKESLDQLHHDNVIKNGYKCQLIKYKL